MTIFSFYSLFDELESQRRFLLDESVQSAFLEQFGVKEQLGKGEVACEQQPGKQRQLQPADKTSSSSSSSDPPGGRQRSSPGDSAQKEQRGSSEGVLPSGFNDSPSSTLEFLDCLF